MQKYNVIIDCDTGIDDAIALILALESEEINVVGISVCAGNTTLDKAYKNTKRICHFLNKNDIPVIKGSNKPLKRNPDLAEDTHGNDGFGGISKAFNKKYAFELEDEDDIDLIDFYSKALDDNEDLNIIAVGPMTNMALVLEAMPEKFAKVKRLISMGGSYKSNGNTSPVAEFNYWFDPEAADYVYQNAPVKVEMVGLDVTRKAVLNDDRLAALKEANKEIGDFIEELTSFYYSYHYKHEGIHGCVINDPLAVASLVDDGLLKGFSSYTRIETEGKSRGACIVDDHDFYGKDHNSIVFTEVDVQRFFDILSQAIRVK